MSAIIYWQNPCKLLMSFRCIKAFMHAFSGRFSRASLEGISFKFFVCFIFNVSLGSAQKRKNFDIQRNTRVGSGGRFTSNRLSNDRIYCKLIRAHKVGKVDFFMDHPQWNITSLNCKWRCIETEICCLESHAEIEDLTLLVTWVRIFNTNENTTCSHVGSKHWRGQFQPK